MFTELFTDSVRLLYETQNIEWGNNVTQKFGMVIFG